MTAPRFIVRRTSAVPNGGLVYMCGYDIMGILISALHPRCVHTLASACRELCGAVELAAQVWCLRRGRYMPTGSTTWRRVMCHCHRGWGQIARDTGVKDCGIGECIAMAEHRQPQKCAPHVIIARGVPGVHMMACVTPSCVVTCTSRCLTFHHLDAHTAAWSVTSTAHLAPDHCPLVPSIVVIQRVRGCEQPGGAPAVVVCSAGGEITVFRDQRVASQFHIGHACSSIAACPPDRIVACGPQGDVTRCSIDVGGLVAGPPSEGTLRLEHPYRQPRSGHYPHHRTFAHVTRPDGAGQQQRAGVVGVGLSCALTLRHGHGFGYPRDIVALGTTDGSIMLLCEWGRDRNTVSAQPAHPGDSILALMDLDDGRIVSTSSAAETRLWAQPANVPAGQVECLGWLQAIIVMATPVHTMLQAADGRIWILDIRGRVTAWM